MSSRQRLGQIVDGLKTKSAQIRALHDAGCSRKEIKGFLGISDQHVSNVIRGEAARRQKFARTAAPGSGMPAKVKVGPEGHVVIPAAFLEKFSLVEGDTLIVSERDDEIVLTPLSVAIRKAQAIVRQLVPDGVSLVDELMAERRREDAGERQPN